MSLLQIVYSEMKGIKESGYLSLNELMNKVGGIQ